MSLQLFLRPNPRVHKRSCAWAPRPVHFALLGGRGHHKGEAELACSSRAVYCVSLCKTKVDPFPTSASARRSRRRGCLGVGRPEGPLARPPWIGTGQDVTVLSTGPRQPRVTCEGAEAPHGSAPARTWTQGYLWPLVWVP